MLRNQNTIFKQGRYFLRANNGFSKLPNTQQVMSCVMFSFLIYSMYFEILDEINTLGAAPMYIIATANVFYTISMLITFGTAFACSFVDPTDSGTKEAIENLLNKKQLTPAAPNEFYCTFCTVYVSKRIKHCKRCNRCVTGFDHHCKWINNCIGDKNYAYFLVMIASCWVMSIAYFTAAIVVFICNTDEMSTARLIKIVIGIGISIVLFMFISNLLTLHIYLHGRGITTYEYIMETRRQQEVSAVNPEGIARTSPNYQQQQNQARKRMPKPAAKSTSIADHFKGKEYVPKPKIVEAPVKDKPVAPVEFHQVNFYNHDQSDDLDMQGMKYYKEEGKVQERERRCSHLKQTGLEDSQNQQQLEDKRRVKIVPVKKVSAQDSTEPVDSVNSRPQRLSKMSIISQYIIAKTFDENAVGFTDGEDHQVQSHIEDADLESNVESEMKEEKDSAQMYQQMESLSTEYPQVMTIECTDEEKLVQSRTLHQERGVHREESGQEQQQQQQKQQQKLQEDDSNVMEDSESTDKKAYESSVNVDQTRREEDQQDHPDFEILVEEIDSNQNEEQERRM